jgi:hypothetical protein
MPGASGAIQELEVTTRVGCRDRINADGEDVFQFSFLQVGGHFWLRDVVDSRTAAAPGGFRKFGEFESGNGF